MLCKMLFSFPTPISNAKTTLKLQFMVVLGILGPNFFDNMMIAINFLPLNIQCTSKLAFDFSMFIHSLDLSEASMDPSFRASGNKQTAF